MKSVFYLFIGVVVLIFFGCGDSVEQSTIDHGVSLQMANARKARLSNINYQLYFDIPLEKSQDIPANVKISFDLESNQKRLLLDFKESTEKVLSVKKNEISISFELMNEHIVINPEYLEIGENEFEISFIAGNLSLNRNDDFLYTLLVPDRARTLFPVFDQPNLKATYDLTLNIPDTWKAVSNGKAINEIENGTKKKISFEKTAPISSYLFAFAAGDFEQLTDPKSGMTMYHREKDTTKVNLNASDIFSLHQQSIDWLEAYTGIAYPYNKFDFVLIPPFQYGGMEHPGSVFYREASLFLDEGASINQKLRRASLIAHETAHMWFGNLVTMDWFNDVWLKEVFANQMASKIVHPSFPEVNHELNFLLSYYPNSLEVDRSEGTHPIQQELTNLQNAGTLYGNIIYNKAPIVMRNLESLMGKEPFQKAIKEYLKTYDTSNATWDDLIFIMKQYTDKNLNNWNRDWVKGKGVPTYETVLDLKNSKATITQLASLNDQKWPQNLNFKATDGIDSIHSIYLNQNSHVLSSEKLNESTLFNIDGKTYGYFKQTQKSWEYTASLIGESSIEVERAAFWINTWEAILHNDLNPVLVFEKLLTAIQKEENPLIINYQLNRISDIFWSLLNEQEQGVYSKKVEALLTKMIKKENDISLKRLLYNSLLRVTYSQKGTAFLVKVWDKKGENLALKLSESELVNLSYQIAVREAERSNEILQEQLKSTKNKDRKNQMEFVMKALSPEESVRDAFFESLSQVENRGSEPWVIQALNLLHHPLRQNTSKKYVQKSLELTEEIQETGDIFFPARWLGSTLNQYSSPKIADQVREFLKDKPDLSPQLRNKVLQAADKVFRTSAIKKSDNKLKL